MYDRVYPCGIEPPLLSDVFSGFLSIQMEVFFLQNILTITSWHHHSKRPVIVLSMAIIVYWMCSLNKRLCITLHVLLYTYTTIWWSIYYKAHFRRLDLVKKSNYSLNTSRFVLFFSSYRKSQSVQCIELDVFLHILWSVQYTVFSLWALFRIIEIIFPQLCHFLQRFGYSDNNILYCVFSKVTWT